MSDRPLSYKQAKILRIIFKFIKKYQKKNLKKHLVQIWRKMVQLQNRINR